MFDINPPSPIKYAPATTLPAATTNPVELTLAPVILPIALTWPPELMLPPVTLPPADTVVTAVTEFVLATPPTLRLAPIILPEALNVVANMSVVVKLPVELIIPSLIKLPPVILPVALTPPAPALILVVAERLFAVTLAVMAKLPPAILPALTMLPVAVIRPAVPMLPPVIFPTTVVVPLTYVSPDTAKVCNGSVFATPTLPTLSTTNFAVAAAPSVDVKTSYLALPVALVAMDLTAVVTLAPGVASLVNHSTAPNTVFMLRVVSVSLNLKVGCPRLASLVIETFPVVFKFPNAALPAITPLTCRLPMTAFPVTLAFPATLIPLDATTNTLLVPPILILALPLAC